MLAPHMIAIFHVVICLIGAMSANAFISGMNIRL
jgi:hypothetical protein